MRRLIAIALLLACILSIVACRSEEITDPEAPDAVPEDVENPYFFCKVLEIEVEGKRCLVEVTDTGNGNFVMGERLLVNTDISGCPSYAVGDHLRVSFDGKVALSYPAQVLCVYQIIKTDARGNRIR